MATSSFNKQFYVSEEKAEEFAKEMERKVEPTLTNEFKSQLKHGKELKQYLHLLTDKASPKL